MLANIWANAAGRKLSNVFYGELIEFVVRFTKAYRAGEEIVSAVSRLSARRLGGRPSHQPIDKREADRIHGQGRAIRQVVRNIRSLVSERPTLEDAALFKLINKNVDRETYPWMRSFGRALRGLHGGRSLKEINTWSDLDLTAEIVRTEIYRKTGKQHSLGEIKKAITARTRHKSPGSK
jgi:hypothetical protein